MDTVTAPSSTYLHGEHPPRTGEEEEEHHEKKPVLKKVMDKVKKIKKAISKKSPRRGNGGADDDHHQQADLDEEEEEFEEDDEIKEDQAVHGGSTAGAGIGAREMPGGEEGAKGAGDGLSFIRTDKEKDTTNEQNQSLLNPKIEQNREYESSAPGAKEISRGGESDEGDGNGLRLTTEKFVGDLTAPTGEARTNNAIDQSRAYESPATSVRTTENEISGGAVEGAERVGDGLGVIKEESVEDPGAHRNEVYKSPFTGSRNGANDISRGEEDGGRVKTGLGLISKEFVQDPTTSSTEAETNTRSEQSRVYESPTSGTRTGANELLGGGREGAKDFVKDPAAPRSDDETNEIFEQGQVHLSPTAGARSGINEISGGGEEGAKAVGDGLGSINMELVEDPAAPNDEAEKNTNTEQIQGGNEVEMSPELSRSLEAMTVSPQNERGETEVSKGGKNSYTDMVSSAASKMYEVVTDAGTAVISKVKPDARKDGDGLGLMNNMELVEDPAAPKDDEVEKNTNIEQSQGGKEAEISPELSRSLEAMTVSSQNERGETELPKNENNSYTGMVSSAASKVYEMVTDAGTAVISKVKPDARKEGEGEAVGNQSKGRSIKEYITEKLTPGEDEKTLSELITEAGQKRKNETVEVPRQVGTGSDDGERGTGVVDKIKETVTSFLGGGGGSPKSPATETQRKVTEDNDDFHRRPPEAISQQKGSSEELPTSYH